MEQVATTVSPTVGPARRQAATACKQIVNRYYFRNSLDSISSSVDCCCSIATQAARSGVITLSQPLQYVCPLSSLSMATLFHIRLISQIKLLKKNMARKIQSLVSNLMPSTTNHIGQKVKEGHLQILFENSILNSHFK